VEGVAMKKNLFILLLCITNIQYVLYGMDVPKNKQEAGDAVIIIVPDNKKKVPNLNLDAATIAGSESTVANVIPKTPIGTVGHLAEHVQKARSTRRTARMQDITQQKNIAQNNDEQPRIVVDDATVTNPPRFNPESSKKRLSSLLPKSLVQQVIGLELPEKQYSEDEVWKMLQHFNPALHSFGKQHGLELEELSHYSELLRTVEVAPEALLEFIKNRSNTGSKSDRNSLSTSRLQALIGQFLSSNDSGINHPLHKQYAKIKEQNPSGYEALVLELMKSVCDNAEGRSNGSKIADTHIGLQADQINDQDTTIRQQWVAIIAQFIGTMGAAAWALYGQINNPSNPGNCTG
jgi:hypothetical protein